MKNAYVLTVFIIAGIIFGFFRYEMLSKNTHILDDSIGEKVLYEGIIVDEPDERENVVRLTVEESKSKAHILASVSRFPKWHYGDAVSISGKLDKPKNFEGNNGREFDYISYLNKDGINYEMYFPKITLKQDKGDKGAAFSEGGALVYLVSNLFKIKNSFTNSIESVIPEPESALLGGLLLGSKHSLGKDLQEEFRRAGVIHIVVLSGYNVSIVAQFIMAIFSFLPKIFGVTCGAIGIIMFATMTGGAASTVRASIMALFVILGKVTGRTYDVTRALFVAGFLMVIYNPNILFGDPGFQLSFMATFGLIFVSPFIENRLHSKNLRFLLKYLPEKFQIRSLVISTTTTQIFLLPLLLYQTGNLSLVALPTNFLILALIPLTMLTGFIAAIFGFISPIIALPFAFVPYILLKYILSVVHFFSNLPFAAITISIFPLWFMILIYFVYAYVLWKFYKRKNPPQVASG